MEEGWPFQEMMLEEVDIDSPRNDAQLAHKTDSIGNRLILVSQDNKPIRKTQKHKRTSLAFRAGQKVLSLNTKSIIHKVKTDK